MSNSARTHAHTRACAVWALLLYPSLVPVCWLSEPREKSEAPEPLDEEMGRQDKGSAGSSQHTDKTFAPGNSGSASSHWETSIRL